MKINLDDGFSFGCGVFETLKIINGKVMNVTRHLKRLNTSLKCLDIEKEITKEEVLDEAKNFANAFKILVSPENTLFLEREDPYVSLNREKGLQVEISNQIRNSTEELTYHKSLAYYNNILGLRKIRENGAFEGLLFNEKDELTEGFISNFFFTKKGKIYTPKVSSGLLEGTMREWLLEEFSIKERTIKKEELENFDGVFLTNSLIGAHWVESIGSKKYKRTEEIHEIIKFLEKLGY